MNVLSKSDVFAENKLFATLDTTVRKVVLENIPFLLSDTVGFIRKLAHDLVESFKSTLDEVREADILIHVVDISHPTFEEQNVVKVLRDYAKRYQHVVVDAGGHDSAELRSAACAADQILIPLRPSIADMDALAETIEVVRMARSFNPDLWAYVVLTMAPTNYRVRDAEIAKMVVQESEHVQFLDCVLHDRKAYRDGLLAGVGPTELARNKDAGALAAGAEIAALIATLFAA